MTHRPTARQTLDALNEMDGLIRRLRLLEPDLRAKTHDTALDGWPRQSGPGHGHGQGGDPVGATVAIRLDHPHHDPHLRAHTTMLTKLHQARRLLEQAESAGRQALPPTRRRNLDDGCVSCARIKTWSPINRTRRCRFCADWSYGHGGEDPPIAILRAHTDGRRITVRLLERIRKR